MRGAGEPVAVWIAVAVGRTYLGHACPPPPSTTGCLAYAVPTVSVKTAAGTVFAQSRTYDGSGWDGHWYRS